MATPRRKPREQFRKAQSFAGWLAVLAAVITVAIPLSRIARRPRATGPEILIYSDWECGDCEQWIAYLQDRGFRTDVRDEPSRPAMQGYLGIPKALVSSHVALADGYVIVGHVPAEDILRLLAEHPDARGLSVPGRPPASPGMEGFGGELKPYDVLLFRGDGTSRIYAHHDVQSVD